MGIVYEAVEDAVGDGGITDLRCQELMGPGWSGSWSVA